MRRQSATEKNTELKLLTEVLILCHREKLKASTLEDLSAFDDTNDS